MALGFTGAIALVWAPVFPAALAAAVVTGFCGTYVAVGLQIGLQSGLEDHLRGRIMSLWMVAVTASTSVMALGLSLAADRWGLGGSVVFLLVVCAGIAGLWGRAARV